MRYLVVFLLCVCFYALGTSAYNRYTLWEVVFSGGIPTKKTDYYWLYYYASYRNYAKMIAIAIGDIFFAIWGVLCVLYIIKNRDKRQRKKGKESIIDSREEALAFYNRGMAFMTGEGEPFSYKDAIYYFELAVEKENLPQALLQLGICYYNSTEAEDHLKAFSYFRKAAIRRNALAEYNVGLCYYLGKGVAKNNYSAKQWLEKSAEQGIVEAKELIERINKEAEEV